jgi:AraC-like DNA-binding protein
MTSDPALARPPGRPGHYPIRAIGDRQMPYVSGVGWQHVSDPGYRWDGLKRGSRPCFIFQYTIAGAGRIERGGQQQRVEPGQCFLVDIPDAHVYCHPPGWPEWEFVYIILAGDSARGMWRRLIERLGTVARLDPRSEAIEILKGLYGRAARGEYLDPLENTEIATRFLLALLAAAERTDALPGGAVSRATSWARDNLREGASVKGMARAAGLSRHHFSRLFKERVGLAPVDYLAALKVRRAAALLRVAASDMEGVAERSGFCSGAHLSRAFKKLTGRSPSEVRKNPHLATDILSRPL